MTETIVYQYGAKKPTENADRAAEQIRLARVYKNRLIEIELDRRKKVDAAIKARGFADLETAEKAVAEIEAELGEARKEAAKANAEARSKKASAHMREAIAEIKARLKVARAAKKQAKSGVWDDPALRVVLDGIDAEDLAARKLARKECGVHWGTYLGVEEAMKDARKGAPPVFRRWNGNGKVQVQLQGGMSRDELESEMDTRLRLSPVGEKSAWANLSLRIGTEGGRNPIMTTAKVKMHRPLPPDGSIKWASLNRKRIGTQEHWTAQFVVQGGTREHQYPKATIGAVGIDVGWRLVPGGLRVCRWVGTDGKSGEVVLPDDLLSRWPKSESLRSIRDGNFDAMRDEFAAWLRMAGKAEMPKVILDAMETLHLWKSPERLGRLWWAWKDARFGGDSEIFEKAKAWRKQDRHLWNWEAHNVAKAIARRLDIYRNFAAELSRRYATAYVEDTNWAKLNRAPKVEEEKPEDAAVRKNFPVAAVGTMILSLSHAMAVAKVAAKDTTRKCAACGHVEAFDASALTRACPKCSAVYDQDDNAAANILAAGLASEEAAKGDAGGARVTEVKESCGGNAGGAPRGKTEETRGTRGGRFRRREGKELELQP